MDTQILDLIMRGILRGAYRPGEKMPSENQLADSYGVPRTTVRQAYEALGQMGYLYSCRGKGWFLRPSQKKLALHLTGEESFTDKMAAKGYAVETRCVEARMVRPRPESTIRRRLGLDPTGEARAYKISRLRSFDSVPAAVHISYLNPQDFPHIETDGPGITSLFAYFRTLGFGDFASGESALSITIPTGSEHEILSCPPLVPLVLLESDTRDGKTGKVLQYTKILYRSDLFTYSL